VPIGDVIDVASDDEFVRESRRGSEPVEVFGHAGLRVGDGKPFDRCLAGPRSLA
jgi:hypothetical protein